MKPPQRLWKGIVLKPSETLAALGETASPAEGSIQLAFGVIAANAVLWMMWIAWRALVQHALTDAFVFTTAKTILLATISFTLPIALIGALFANALAWVVAWLLGGRRGYWTQFNLVAATYAPAGALAMVFISIPPLGLAGIALALLAYLYGVYLASLALREAHGLSFFNAVVSAVPSATYFALFHFLALALLPLFYLPTIGP
ncbi:MAG: YIP1 family protein [Candidatus Micrarchaeota archaeon]|nr:YIP1 family protein [Candidatus Micrarchaeota archaeon]